MEEVWKEIKGYNGIYFISNEGRIKSFQNGNCKILKAKKGKTDYMMIGLTKDKKRKWFYVHRLVLMTFCPNNNSEKMQVNHKDENKNNNNLNNLEWVTRKQNCNYGNRNFKINQKNLNRADQSLKVLCVETNIIFPSASEAQRQTKVNLSNLLKVCYGKAKTAGGYHWKFV